MTPTQNSRIRRRARKKEKLRGGAYGMSSEDPQLRRMLTLHIHCGQEMQLVSVDPAPPSEGSTGRNDGGPLAYRCACGFSFDQPLD